MPEFTLNATADAPVEEVWKLLFDPTRIPEWWAGIRSVRLEGAGAYTLWYDGMPDDAMPQQMRAERREGRVTMSCQVNEIDLTWQLTEIGDGTGISVQVVIAPAKADLFDRMHQILALSLPALAALAEVGGKVS